MEFLRPQVIFDDDICQEKYISSLISKEFQVPVEVLVNIESSKELEDLKLWKRGSVKIDLVIHLVLVLGTN